METLQRQSLFISKEQIISPLVAVLNTVTQKSPDKVSPSRPLSQSINESLGNLFPEQKYDEKNIQKTKEMLGKTVNQFSLEQLNDVVAEVQYLTDSWLDDFERKTFGGVTLQELLHEKGTL